MSAANAAAMDSRNDTPIANRILAAGEIVFGRLGVRFARLEDVLAEADVSRSTFYRYFRGKDHLFDGVCRSHFEALVESVQTGVQDRGRPPIEALVDAFFAWRLDSGLLSTAVDADQTHLPGLRGMRREAFDRIAALMADGAGRRCGETDLLLWKALLAGLEKIGADVWGQLTPADLEERRSLALRILKAGI